MFLIMDTQVDLLRDRQADLKRPNLVKHLPETKSGTMESICQPICRPIFFNKDIIWAT